MDTFMTDTVDVLTRTPAVVSALLARIDSLGIVLRRDDPAATPR